MGKDALRPRRTTGVGVHTVVDPSRWPDPVRAAPGFLEITGATLLVGRLVPFRGRGEELLARWDGWSAALDDDDRCAVPAHDLSRFSEYAGFEGRFLVAVGIAVRTAHADEGPSAPFDGAAVAAATERARRHDRTYARLARELDPLDAWSLRTQRTRALLVPFGPIASARIAFGTRVDATAPRALGVERVRGRDMRDRPHDHAIDGVAIASAAAWDVAEIAPLDPPPIEGAFHLVPRYG